MQLVGSSGSVGTVKRGIAVAKLGSGPIFLVDAACGVLFLLIID